MTYYFTFGQNHLSDEGFPLKDYWIEIEGHTSGDALYIMCELYDNRWSMQYSKEDFSPEFFPKGCLKKIRKEEYLFPEISKL